MTAQGAQGAQQVLGGINTVVSTVGMADPTVKAGEVIGQAEAAVIQAIGGISDQKKRTEFMAAFNSLSQSQKKALGEKIMATNDNLTKLQMLTSALVSVKLNKTATTAAASNRVVIIIASSIFVMVVLSAFIKKSKINRHE